MLVALGLLVAGNCSHLGIDPTCRLGIATLLMLIALVGGRIVPSFTRNWLAKRNAARMPASKSPSTASRSLSPLPPSAPGCRTPPGRSCWAARRSRFVLRAGVGLLPCASASITCTLVMAGLLSAWFLSVSKCNCKGAARAHCRRDRHDDARVMTRASLGHSGRALTADAATMARVRPRDIGGAAEGFESVRGCAVGARHFARWCGVERRVRDLAIHYGRFLRKRGREGHAAHGAALVLAPGGRRACAAWARQVLIKVRACGVRRTDLHLIDGELPGNAGSRSHRAMKSSAR